jgi:tripartite ATP-independent transporter DctM subunit
MFAVALALMLIMGLPAYAVLLATSALFAAIGLAMGAFDASLFGVLPLRLVGLLEHDLLQALPLFALTGALLHRVPLIGLLHRAGAQSFTAAGCHPAKASQLSAQGVGALLAPMNGSVGAGLYSLARGVYPALLSRGVAPHRANATVCVASTLGVVIPPSLVLLLFGDAMMRAHTEAVNVTKAAVRIVNTQDVLRAALLPGALVVLLALAVTGLQRQPAATKAPLALPALRAREWGLSLATFVIIVALLVGVATGRFYAVEAAATGCMVALVVAACCRQLPWARLRLVLGDAMEVTGSLMALLVGATVFSMVFRAFDADALVSRTLQGFSSQPALLIGLVLAGLVLCSFVLDAFEIIFLVIPIVMPPVLMVVPDAAWMAAVTLLVLQLGFLLPPLGYALTMSRSLLKEQASLRDVVAALWPHIAAQIVLIALVIAFPALTQWARAS